MLFSFTDVSHDYIRKQGILGLGEVLHAVRQVSFSLGEGETLGLVGESGCGKSTVGRITVGLQAPSQGDVTFLGQPLYQRGRLIKHADLCKDIQMIFQNPYSSLNPRLRVIKSVMEPLVCMEPQKGQEHEETALSILSKVGITREQAYKYPHEFSGGQRQRIAIARALVTSPAFVVCDEPTSSLDSSVQAQILNLLLDMQEDLGVSYLFISHDLTIVKHMSDRVMVMYAGAIVEEAPTEVLFNDPKHPYTRLLFAASFFDKVEGAVELLPEKNFGSMKERCPFFARCPNQIEQCGRAFPELLPLQYNVSHRVRCFAYS